MTTMRVSHKGWVVIPKALRDRLGIKPGTRVNVYEREGEVIVVPVEDDPITRGRGLLAGTGAADDLLASRRAEREAEDAGAA